MRVYIKKQEETVVNNSAPNKKMTKRTFNIVKVGNGEMSRVHGETIDKNGKVMRITSERKRVGDYKQFIHNNNNTQPYKLKSGDIYSIFDEPNMGKLFTEKSIVKKGSVKGKKSVKKGKTTKSKKSSTKKEKKSTKKNSIKKSKK